MRNPNDAMPFASGQRVILTARPDGYPAAVAGMAGRVEIIDGIGTVHIRWDDGHRFGITAEFAYLLRAES